MLLVGIRASAIVRVQTHAIRIGQIPFSHRISRYCSANTQSWESLKLAAEEVNVAGGVLGRKIELVYCRYSINPENSGHQGRASNRARQGCNYHW